MMNSEKCDCKKYAGGEHRAPLLKLDLPEYDDYRYAATSHTVLRAIRLIGYALVLVLLSYSLWRIRAIESRLEASDKLSNITRLLQSSGSSVFHKRTARAIQGQMLNAFGSENKKGAEIGKDSMAPWRKPTNKGEFDELVNDLFDKIKAMHDDDERGHFDRNMKAVFQAWFPVFDALLPRELKDDADTRKTRRASEEYYYRPRFARDADPPSDESEGTGSEPNGEEG